jgi:hypothetical protein
MTKPWDSNPGVTTRKVFIEFRSETFGKVDLDELSASITTSRGTLDGVDIVRDPDGDPRHVRLFFNLNSTDAEAADVSATVTMEGHALTETVICQVWPKERAGNA